MDWLDQQRADYSPNCFLHFTFGLYNSLSAPIHLYMIRSLDLVSSLLFGTKELSYVLIISGISFHFGGIFIRFTMDEKTVGYFKEEYRAVDSVQFLLGCTCTILGILGFVAA